MEQTPDVLLLAEPREILFLHRPSDQVKTIIKKGWFSELEILEIHKLMIREACQQDPNTVTKILNAGK